MGHPRAAVAADRRAGSWDGPGVAPPAGRGRVVLHRDAAPSRLRHRRLGEARDLGGAVALGSAGPAPRRDARRTQRPARPDRKSTRLNSSHPSISYAVFCLKKKKNQTTHIYLKKTKKK